MTEYYQIIHVKRNMLWNETTYTSRDEALSVLAKIPSNGPFAVVVAPKGTPFRGSIKPIEKISMWRDEFIELLQQKLKMQDDDNMPFTVDVFSNEYEVNVYVRWAYSELPDYDGVFAQLNLCEDEEQCYVVGRICIQGAGSMVVLSETATVKDRWPFLVERFVRSTVHFRRMMWATMKWKILPEMP